MKNCKDYLDLMERDGLIRYHWMTMDRNFLRVYIGYVWGDAISGGAFRKRLVDGLQEDIEKYKDMYICVEVYGSFLPLGMRVPLGEQSLTGPRFSMKMD